MPKGQTMSEKGPSLKVYTAVFICLLILLVLSAVVAQFHLGAANTVVALGISVAKATLIVLFFMHVYYSGPMVRLAAVGGLMWLGILLVLTFSDYQTRNWHMLQWTEYEATTLDRVRPTLQQLEHRSPPAEP
jgi:cytochrome c oxidase subunit 4